jgi:hypothetical protein
MIVVGPTVFALVFRLRVGERLYRIAHMANAITKKMRRPRLG